MSPRPHIPRAHARARPLRPGRRPDRQVPAPIPGPSARPPEPGAGAFPPSRGVMGPYRARVPVADKRRRRATPNIRSQDLGAPQDALLAFALRAPVPPAFGPGPSPKVFPPIPGGESRAISRLNDVSPGSPNVLRAIPRPMTGVPRIAGGRRRRHFYQGRRRLCRHNRCGRWGRS